MYLMLHLNEQCDHAAWAYVARLQKTKDAGVSQAVCTFDDDVRDERAFITSNPSRAEGLIPLVGCGGLSPVDRRRAFLSP